MSSCSSDDNNENYDEIKGYLTDLENVKRGLIGTWECPDEYGLEEITFDESAFSRIYKEVGYDDNDRLFGIYSVSSSSGKFYIQMRRSSGSVINAEIHVLNKTTLVLHTEEQGYVYIDTYTRK